MGMDRQDSVISARDLSIEYDSASGTSRFVAVKGVTFDVAAGEVLGVIGESGSGKSTLAMTIAGLAGPGDADDRVPAISGGTLTVLGTRLRHMSHRARNRLTLRVGYLPQDGAQRLNSRMTVAENVGEPIFLRDRKFDSNDAGQAVATLIDAVHLPLSVLGLMPYQLSSGQRQRVALARALILDPVILVADEPIRGIDIMVRHDVLAVIPELRESRGFAAVVVSSDLAAIDQVADRVAVFHDGIVIGLGPLDELLRAPEHPYLKSLARTLGDPPVDHSPNRTPR